MFTSQALTHGLSFLSRSLYLPWPTITLKTDTCTSCWLRPVRSQRTGQRPTSSFCLMETWSGIRSRRQESSKLKPHHHLSRATPASASSRTSAPRTKKIPLASCSDRRRPTPSSWPRNTPWVRSTTSGCGRTALGPTTTDRGTSLA